MVAEFLAWYGRQMQDVLAGLARPRRVREPDGWTVMTGVGGAMTAALVKGGQTGPALPLQAAPIPDGAAVTLALPQERLLVRDVRVPEAAAANLRAVLEFEMDRLTPFPAASLCWSFETTGHDLAKGELLVRLFLLPLARIAGGLDVLAERGLTVRHVAAAAGGRMRRLDLIPPDPVMAARTRRRTVAAWSLCSALAVAAIVVPVAQTAAAMDGTAAEIARLRPQVAKAEALRRQITGEGTGAGALADTRLQAGRALRAVAALTDALPDDTYLTAMTLKGTRVSLEGQSAAATKLIAALSSQPNLRNPSFAAPVVRTESQAEIFAIQAEAGF